MTATIPNNDVGKNWPQILAILSATLISFTSGIVFAWPSPSIPILISEDYPLEITLEEASWLTVLPAVAVIISSPLSGRMIDLIGRKKSVMLIALPQLISWILVAWGGSIYVFYAARIISGLADSCSFAAVPTYISEVATPKVRGTWGNAITFFIFFGNLIMNVVGSQFYIRTAAFILMPIPIIFILIFSVMPETPYYLVMTGRDEEAKESLKFLSRKKNVDEDYKNLKADVDRQLSEPGTYKDVFTIGSNRRAVIVGVIIRGAQQYSGISAFAMYAQYIFEQSGSNISSSMSAIIFSAFCVVANLFSSCIVDIIGKRVAMLVSSAGCFLMLSLLSIYFYMFDHTSYSFESFKLFPVISMTLFIFFFSIGLGLVPTVMLGELFSSSIKGKALSLMNVAFGLYISTSAMIFSMLLKEYGLYAPYAFFAVCCFLSIITSYVFVPETRGKTLEEIQQDFKSKTKK